MCQQVNITNRYNCQIEANRMATDKTLRRKRPIMALYYSLFREAGGTAAGNMIFTVPPAWVAKVPFGDKFVIGSFRYYESDPYTASLASSSYRAIFPMSLLNGITGGTIFAPSLVPRYDDDDNEMIHHRQAKAS